MGKKTLILTDRFYPEEFIINDLVEDIKEKQKDIEILTQNPSYPFGEVAKFSGFTNKIYKKTYYKNIIVRRLFTVQGYKDNKIKKVLHYINFSIIASIYLIIHGRKYRDIFIFQTGPLIQAIPAILSKKIYKSKVTIWTLDLWPDTVYAYGFQKTKLIEKILNTIVKFVYKNCDVIFVSSQGFIKRINDFVPFKEIKFIPQWAINDSSNSHESILDEKMFNVTFTGNIAKTQNLENVILGFQKAVVENKLLCLNIFGDGSNLDALKSLVSKECISNIKFWGRFPQKKMSLVMTQSNALLISLRPDPLYDLYIPLKFSAYLSSCKPILAVMKGEVPNLVSRYQIGYPADPSDIDDISNKLLMISNSNIQFYKQCAENARKLANDIFDKSKVIVKILQEFDPNPL